MVVFFAILFYPSIDGEMINKLSPKNANVIINGLKYSSLIAFLVAMFFIYLNLLVLTPKFLLKNKISVYLLFCFLSVLLMYISEIIVSKQFLYMVEELAPLPKFTLKSFVDSSLIPIVFLAASAGYQVFKKWVVDSAQLAALKQTKVEQELTNLKNQINPHFLFNTLNNLNTLITVDADKASAVVLGLSDVLRYQLYEAVEDKVLLKKDIEILQQYLELEKIRRDNFQFSINTEPEVFNVLIPPFIFINFVENAIKHSVDNMNFSYISVHYTITNGRLHFTCKNSKPSIIKTNLNGGLGLQNIKRRLELIYEDRFELQIKSNSNEFVIELYLPL